MKKTIKLNSFPIIQEYLQKKLDIVCSEIAYMERIISGIDKEKNASLYSEKRKNYTDSLAKMQAEYDEIIELESIVNYQSCIAENESHPFIPTEKEHLNFDRIYCGNGKIYESEDLNDN